MRALVVGMVVALLLGSALVAPARAEEPELLAGEAPPKPETIVVEEKAALRLELATTRLENIQLSLELGRRQLRDLVAEREQIGREAAKAAGLAWDDYDVDLTQRPPVWRLKKR